VKATIGIYTLVDYFMAKKCQHSSCCSSKRLGLQKGKRL
jgi:hypothetical protein